mmetsp:Transcript_2726/g.7994  ORF Transcript_2726/g.7994 Transcript_2726/m.7994 type:complete len:681 (-) Transcript_2726:26-2068(-)
MVPAPGRHGRGRRGLARVPAARGRERQARQDRQQHRRQLRRRHRHEDRPGLRGGQRPGAGRAPALRRPAPVLRPRGARAFGGRPAEARSVEGARDGGARHVPRGRGRVLRRARGALRGGWLGQALGARRGAPLLDRGRRGGRARALQAPADARAGHLRGPAVRAAARGHHRRRRRMPDAGDARAADGLPPRRGRLRAPGARLQVEQGRGLAREAVHRRDPRLPGRDVRPRRACQDPREPLPEAPDAGHLRRGPPRHGRARHVLPGAPGRVQGLLRVPAHVAGLLQPHHRRRVPRHARPHQLHGRLARLRDARHGQGQGGRRGHLPAPGRRRRAAPGGHLAAPLQGLPPAPALALQAGQGRGARAHLRVDDRRGAQHVEPRDRRGRARGALRRALRSHAQGVRRGGAGRARGAAPAGAPQPHGHLHDARGGRGVPPRRRGLPERLGDPRHRLPGLPAPAARLGQALPRRRHAAQGPALRVRAVHVQEHVRVRPAGALHGRQGLAALPRGPLPARGHGPHVGLRARPALLPRHAGRRLHAQRVGEAAEADAEVRRRAPREVGRDLLCAPRRPALHHARRARQARQARPLEQGPARADPAPRLPRARGHGRPAHRAHGLRQEQARRGAAGHPRAPRLHPVARAGGRHRQDLQNVQSVLRQDGQVVPDRDGLSAPSTQNPTTHR